MDKFHFFLKLKRRKRSQRKSARKSDLKYRQNRIYSGYRKPHISDRNDCRTFSGGFYAAMGTVITIGQCFGIMPVIGVKQASAAKLSFAWLSFRSIYSIIVAVAAIAYAFVQFWHSFHQKIEFGTFLSLAFFSTTSFGICRFIIIARHWPELMRQWEFVEAILARLRRHRHEQQLAIQIRIIAVVILALIFAEHTLNTAMVLYDATVLTPDKNPFEELFKTQLPYVFTYTKFTWWKAIIAKWFNIILTFVWSYTDLFVILLSIGLSTLYEQINCDLEHCRGKHKGDKFWILRRIQYRKIGLLVRMVDQIFSPSIFVALATDLIFIVAQLHNSIHPKASLTHGLYFWLSLGFLIARTLALALYTAKITDESKKPIDVIRDVPRQSYTKELTRFTEEIVNSEIALSGMQFFFMTRKLILSVVGAIITYELVLMQFDDD